MLDQFNLAFSPAALIEVLPIMGKGLIGVFAVICAIWGFVALLNKVTASKQDAASEE